MLEFEDLSFDVAIDAHDAVVANLGGDIWVGAEPTFTLRFSEAPEWLCEALGEDKLAYALRLVEELRALHPGSLVLRSVGRQYAGEDCPRWSVGLYARRDGVAFWRGPPDPLAGTSGAPSSGQLEQFRDALADRLISRGCSCLPFDLCGALGCRLLVSLDGAEIRVQPGSDPRLARPSVHRDRTPPDGLHDPLASEDLLLMAIGEVDLASGHACACIELPAIARVADFLQCIEAVDAAATAVGLSTLVLQGFPPPVDQTVAWTTVTPDPAVVEINQAPQPNVGRFLAAMRELFAVVQHLGLSPYRLQYNGTVSDSGGGGQFTLGGPSAHSSPFFLQPALLPRWVRYLNWHPALSYLFAPDYLGGASQSPRPDEGIREAFRELDLTLEQMRRHPQASPEFLWASLAPFLADPSGNAHRSELNIEKLWNPYLPGRGRLGLVEFRAFRMPRSPERASAIAALLRAVTALLIRSDPAPGLRDWGDTLHDRYALPFFLSQDLREVLRDLSSGGLGLTQGVEAMLLEEPTRSVWSTAFAGCLLTLEPAVEFWPLVGDVASQEAGGSRLVDSSTARLQISLREDGTCGRALAGWELRVGDTQVPLRDERDETGELRLIGLRYRAFRPWRGLHPAIPPQGPLTLTLSHPEADLALEASLHGWRPDGLPYDGLPRTIEAAAERRAERLVIRQRPRAELPAARAAPQAAVSDYILDLRRL
jgi:uncharacterized protein (DUF2126 family)